MEPPPASAVLEVAADTAAAAGEDTAVRQAVAVLQELPPPAVLRPTQRSSSCASCASGCFEFLALPPRRARSSAPPPAAGRRARSRPPAVEKPLIPSSALAGRAECGLDEVAAKRDKGASLRTSNAKAAEVEDEDSPVDTAVPEDGEEETCSPVTCASADVGVGEEVNDDAEPVLPSPTADGETLVNASKQAEVDLPPQEAALGHEGDDVQAAHSEEDLAGVEEGEVGAQALVSPHQVWWHRTLREQAQAQGIVLIGSDSDCVEVQFGKKRPAAAQEAKCDDDDDEAVAAVFLEFEETPVYTVAVPSRPEDDFSWTEVGGGVSVKLNTPRSASGMTRPHTVSTEAPAEEHGGASDEPGQQRAEEASPGGEWRIPQEHTDGPQEPRLHATEHRHGTQGGFICLRTLCCPSAAGGSTEAAAVLDFTIVEDEQVRPQASSIFSCWVCPS